MFLRAVGEQREHNERSLHADKASKPGVASLKLLHNEAVLDVVHAGTAVTFQVGTEKAESSHLGNQLFGKRTLVESIAHQRKNTIVHKAARRLANHEFLFT